MIHSERLVREFIELVSIDSPSFGERTMGDYLKNQLAALGLTVEEDGAGSRLGGNCGNLYVFLEGRKDLEPILFCVHMDTVEPSAGKRAVLDGDGVIRSRGDTVLGADDFAGIVAILEALRVIHEQNLTHRPVEILFTVAEEVYCKGAKQFDFSKVRSKEAYVLDLSGPVGSAACQAPTILSFTVEVHGKASHAGFAPQEGVHAIQAAADAVAGLSMGKIDEHTTLNIGSIHGGLATNIVPDLCVLSGEIRSYSHEKAMEVAETVQKQFLSSAHAVGAAVDFDIQIGCRAYETPLGHPVIRRFETACQTLHLPSSLHQTFGGSDNNILAEYGISGIVLACAMNQCHSCTEYTTVDELVRISELTKVLMISED